MKSITNTWLLVVPAFVITAVTIFLLKRKRSYKKVGVISKLFFFPVKSLKAVEVESGLCTKTGFEVDGLLDRSFMLVNEEGVLISQRDTPTMVHLIPRIEGNILIITKPCGKELKVEIKNKIFPDDKILNCRLFGDIIQAVDCGDEAANFFQSFLHLPIVRLVHYFPLLPARSCKSSKAFEVQSRNKYPIAFPDFAPFHVLSQASIDDLNSKLNDEKIDVLNFRPNILAENCSAFAEDSWRYLKFPSGAELNNFMMTARCLLTTNNPFTAVFSKKEPLITLRKYRIPTDPDILKKNGSIPCFGIYCGVATFGEISVGDHIYADVGQKPVMKVK